MGLEPFKRPYKTITTFLRECWGTPVEQTDEEKRLHDLAIRYHRDTEAYDRCVCTGGLHHGAAMPADGREHALINRNARETFDHLFREHVAGLGFSRGKFLRAIGAAAREVGRPNPIHKTYDLHE